MTDKELFMMVLESLERLNRTGDTQVFDMFDAPVLIPALRARLAQPEQEPVKDWVTSHNEICVLLKQAHDALALTSYPPKREWVGLTDEELHALHFELKVQTMGGINTLGVYRILEKALREKNT